MPVNDGFYRLVGVDAPAGTVVNCTRPAPVVGGWETHARLVEVLFRALLPAFPERVPAGTKGMMCQAGFGSLDAAAGSTRLLRDVRRRLRRPPWRATARTPSRRTARTPRTRRSRRPRSTTRCGSLRSSWSRTRRGRAGSAAASGCARTTASTAHDRSRSSPTATSVGPWGAFGGHAGRVAEYVLVRDGEATRLGSKSTVELVPGDVISVRTCGGGGYGPPEEREPERVLRDVLEGKVSAERARDVYRVAIADRRRRRGARRRRCAREPDRPASRSTSAARSPTRRSSTRRRARARSPRS